MKLTFEEAHKILQAKKNCVLLDVREEPEYLSGHAVDAILLPVDEISVETAENAIPNVDCPVLVYCRTGRRSARAVTALQRLGYREVYDLGGLVGWPYGLE